MSVSMRITTQAVDMALGSIELHRPEVSGVLDAGRV